MTGPLPFAFAYTFPAVTVFGVALGGPWAWSTVVVAFVLTPVLDALVAPNFANPEPGADATHPWWDRLLVAWLPVQLATMALTLARVGAGGSPGEIAGWIFSLGITTGGGGITVAHELMHRRSRWHQALAEALMTLVLYPHFCIEHVLGHHRNVATPEDPASARRGESVWRFLVRSVVGGLRSAWRLEGERVRNRGLGWTEDRRFRQPVMVALLVGLSAALGGAAVVLALIAQALVAVVLLEVINYVEHYGLARVRRKDGRYERVRPEHSWNSPHRITGWYLFNLPRHSDHHFLASRPYPLLRHHVGAPQLPAGYPTMVLLALIPPLWRRVMDPKVDAWNAGEVPAAG